MAGGGVSYVCRCFFTRNIFLKDYAAHVVFEDQQQFFHDYRTILQNRGCKTDDQWEDVLTKIKKEVDRRTGLGEESVTRQQIIQQQYKPLHPHLYTLQESFLAESFLQLVQYSRSDGANASGMMSIIQQCTALSQVYSFQVFTPEFCKELVEEICHFESSDVPKGRPNTMNNYGVLLNELGFDGNFFDPLRADYLIPITKLLYPEWGGDALDSQKAFIVQYKMGEDVDLSYHYDNAEVTLNVSLGSTFSGGALYFGGMRQEPQNEAQYVKYEHTPTYGLLHRGQHMHGALPIQSGHRYNLIIWMRSSKIRNNLCPMCGHPPKLVSTQGSGDGFTCGETVALCAAL